MGVFALVITAAYANSLQGGFHLDDWYALVQNPHIRSLANIPRFFIDPQTTTVLPENRDLRPILLVSFAINYALSGEAVWSYHLLNLLLHWLAVVLVFRIVRDHLWLGEDAVPLAAAAALIVAAHPLNTEPVNYLYARSALLTAVFYLAAFDAAIRDRRLASAVLLTLALLTKAIAVTFPLVLAGYWWFARRQSPQGQWRGIPWGFLATLGAVAVGGGVLYRLWLVPPEAIQGTHEADVTPCLPHDGMVGVSLLPSPLSVARCAGHRSKRLSGGALILRAAGMGRPRRVAGAWVVGLASAPTLAGAQLRRVVVFRHTRGRVHRLSAR